MNLSLLNALSASALNFIRNQGKTLAGRYQSLNDGVDVLRKYGIYPFGNRVLNSRVATVVEASVGGNPLGKYLNFSSQDYLGLAQAAEVREAAKEIINRLGVHTAASPVLSGRNSLTEALGGRLASVFQTGQCLLYSTGWSACFGVMASLVNE
jgi:7-keto-8-aminopelargonate synthetase-like enzyme